MEKRGPVFNHGAMNLQTTCIMCVQYIGGSSVHQGNIMSILGHVGGTMGALRCSFSTWRDIVSTLQDVQYIGGIS